MSNVHNIYPFQLPEQEGTKLFCAYMQTHREQLHKERGTWCYTWVGGVAGNYKLFSWYQVDVTVLSPTEVCFTTYDMAGSYGGRGQMEHEIPATCPESRLAEVIAARRLTVAEAELERREQERARLAHQAAVHAVHLELFGELPCTSNA